MVAPNRCLDVRSNEAIMKYLLVGGGSSSALIHVACYGVSNVALLT